jgi:hypothetical protein
MSKKRISADDLTFLIVERLRQNDPIATPHMAIAVVPHRTLGWSVAISRRATKKRAGFVEQINRIQAELRKHYSLED